MWFDFIFQVALMDVCPNSIGKAIYRILVLLLITIGGGGGQMGERRHYAAKRKNKEKNKVNVILKEKKYIYTLFFLFFLVSECTMKAPALRSDLVSQYRRREEEPTKRPHRRW